MAVLKKPIDTIMKDVKGKNPVVGFLRAALLVVIALSGVVVFLYKRQYNDLKESYSQCKIELNNKDAKYEQLNSQFRDYIINNLNYKTQVKAQTDSLKVLTNKAIKK